MASTVRNLAINRKTASGNDKNAVVRNLSKTSPDILLHMKRLTESVPLIDRLDLVVLEQIRLRQMTLKQAALHHNVTPTHLSRVLKSVGFVQEPSIIAASRQAASDSAQERIEDRKSLAAQVAAGKITLQKACELALCSERTIWRYIANTNLKSSGLFPRP